MNTRFQNGLQKSKKFLLITAWVSVVLAVLYKFVLEPQMRGMESRIRTALMDQAKEWHEVLTYDGNPYPTE